MTLRINAFCVSKVLQLTGLPNLCSAAVHRSIRYFIFRNFYEYLRDVLSELATAPQDVRSFATKAARALRL